MKKVITILASISLFALTATAHPAFESSRRLVGHAECGTPIYAFYEIVGHTRCGDPIFGWVTHAPQVIEFRHHDEERGRSERHEEFRHHDWR